MIFPTVDGRGGGGDPTRVIREEKMNHRGELRAGKGQSGQGNQY